MKRDYQTWIPYSAPACCLCTSSAAISCKAQHRVSPKSVSQTAALIGVLKRWYHWKMNFEITWRNWSYESHTLNSVKIVVFLHHQYKNNNNNNHHHHRHHHHRPHCHRHRHRHRHHHHHHHHPHHRHCHCHRHHHHHHHQHQNHQHHHHWAIIGILLSIAQSIALPIGIHTTH